MDSEIQTFHAALLFISDWLALKLACSVLRRISLLRESLRLSSENWRCMVLDESLKVLTSQAKLFESMQKPIAGQNLLTIDLELFK